MMPHAAGARSTEGREPDARDNLAARRMGEVRILKGQQEIGPVRGPWRRGNTE